MDKKKKALAMVLSAYLFWGVQPLYWSLFQGLALEQIMAHRILWSIVFVVPVALATGRKKALFDHLKSPKAIFVSAICGVMIGLNWGLNIYSVGAGRVIEASLGQYITPVAVLFIGAVWFKEKTGRLKKIAIGLTAAGMINAIVMMGRVPLLAVAVTGTFLIYTLIKKVNPGDPVISFLVELIALAPLAAGYLVYLQRQGGVDVFGGDLAATLLLASTGCFTGYALMLFSTGVRDLDFTNLGFIQYLSPTISLVIGALVFGEPFTQTHWTSFAFIWTGVFLAAIAPLISKRKEARLGMIEDKAS